MKPSIALPAPARAAVTLSRSTPTEWGVLWEQSTADAPYTPAPVDLSFYSARLELRDPRSDELWHATRVQASLNGVIVAHVDPDLFTNPDWTDRTGGSWSITLIASDGRVERLAEGPFTLEP